MTAIKQAFINVSDKAGVVEFAQGLQQLGIGILSFGSSAKLLADSGIPIIDVADYSSFPELLNGSVSTPQAGIPAQHDLPEGIAARSAHDLQALDLVVVNLNPFRASIDAPDCTMEDAMLDIDIGGPTMVRTSAKNHHHVAIVTDPADYPAILAELRAGKGAVSGSFRFRLAQKAMSHAAAYDSSICNYLTAVNKEGARSRFPAQINLSFAKVQDMHHGENPHQQAAFYRDLVPVAGGISGHTQLQGKELSFNDVVNADVAWELVKCFRKPACAIVKHANPCGAAIADSALNAYRLAFAADNASASGGIIAINRELDPLTAAQVTTNQFVELIIAPSVSAAALMVTAPRKNLRVLAVPPSNAHSLYDLRRVNGGLLVQTPDEFDVQAGQLKVVTRAQPGDAQLQELLFAWRVAKFVKSNAIVFCKGGQTLGVGAGQMSRADGIRIARIRAQASGLSLEGSVVASDGFIPLRDGIKALAAAGAIAVIQPGGSKRDKEVIAAADELGLAMVFTGYRHFRH